MQASPGHRPTRHVRVGQLRSPPKQKHTIGPRRSGQRSAYGRTHPLQPCSAASWPSCSHGHRRTGSPQRPNRKHIRSAGSRGPLGSGGAEASRAEEVGRCPHNLEESGPPSAQIWPTPVEFGPISSDLAGFGPVRSTSTNVDTRSGQRWPGTALGPTLAKIGPHFANLSRNRPNKGLARSPRHLGYESFLKGTTGPPTGRCKLHHAQWRI